jgi:putative ABC transport system permease protein
MSAARRRWTDRLLQRVLPPGPVGDSIRGDLLEDLLSSDGGFAARARYTAQAMSIAMRYLLRRDATLPHTTIPRKDTMDAIRQDLRFAVRALVRRPSLPILVIATLALGIGAATAIFSIVDAILLRPLPFPAPEQLVVFNETTPRGRMTLAWPNYVDIRDRATSFEAIAGSQSTSFTLIDGDTARRVDGRLVSSAFLRVLAVAPQLGRDFTDQDDRVGADPVAIVSHRFWTQDLGRDPNVIGRPLRTTDRVYTIVGVLPPGFRYVRDADLLVPNGMVMLGNPAFLDRGNHFGLFGTGRLRKGVSVRQAQSELQRIAADLEKAYPNTNSGNGSEVQLLRDRLVEGVKPMLVALMGAVGFLLLLACANVANLLLARGAARQHELAVRTALGGSRWRLVRHLLTESVLLSFGGGLFGVALAFGLVKTLVALAPPDTPRLDLVAINQASLAFAVAASVVCGVFFGAFPALQSSGRNGEHLLARASRTSAAVAPRRTRRVLMAVEVALAAVRSLPGVSAAALTLSLPIEGSQWGSVFIVSGKPVPPRAELPSAAFVPISSGYFQTMGISLKRGRDFTAQDNDRAPRVVIVNATLARRLWPGDDPIGKRIKQGWPESPSPWREVVGVAADVKLEGIDRDTPMQVFVPMPQDPVRNVAIVARTTIDPEDLAKSVQSAVQSVEPTSPVSRVQPMTELMTTALATRRLSTMIFAVFAGVAVLIAAIGLYGVVSHSVTERTHEIGVRMALGAERRRVLRLFIGHGLTTASVGVVIGGGIAVWLSRRIESLLFGVNPTDPATLAAVSLLLIVVASLACYIPARRATRVDPLIALRSE